MIFNHGRVKMENALDDRDDHAGAAKSKRRWKIWTWRGFLVLVVLYLLTMSYHSFKQLPDGISMEGKIHSVSDQSIEFLYDLTYENENGEVVVEQEIFDRILAMIDDAEEYILLDMFLFDTDEDAFRDLSTELVDRLIEKKNQSPATKFQIMTDMYNTLYGSIENEPLGRLEDAGFHVAFSDMDRLRDSNFLYSGIWRIFFQVFGLPKDYSHSGLIEIDGVGCSPRSLFKALNCKANHRKIIVADCGDKVQSLVTSANPSAYGSKYSNVALFVEETSHGIHHDIYQSEKAIAAYSDEDFVEHEFPDVSGDLVESASEPVSIQFVTEGKIRKSMTREIEHSGKGDAISVAMFLLTERNLVEALVEASERGVAIRVIVDPSKYLFGQDSEGVPNRPVMSELHDRSDGKIQIRWYHTHGEEFHSKMVILSLKNGGSVVFLGSANLTRRNIGDYNLEADIRVVASRQSDLIKEIDEYYNRIWKNSDGVYTLDYDELDDDSWYRYTKYWLQERTGLCAW